jgi:hypothetical protein
LRSVLERWRKVGKIGKVVHEFLNFSVPSGKLTVCY